MRYKNHTDPTCFSYVIYVYLLLKTYLLSSLHHGLNDIALIQLSIYSVSLRLFQTDMTTYKKVSLLFHIYAYSDTLLAAEDDAWRVECRSDDLTGLTVLSENADIR